MTNGVGREGYLNKPPSKVYPWLIGFGTLALVLQIQILTNIMLGHHSVFLWFRSGVAAVLAGFLGHYVFRVRYMKLDHTTGLFRRLSIEERLEEFEQSKKDVTIAFIDINGLRETNNNFGHGVGDELIKELAARIRDYCPVKSRKIAGRLGGDEFIIIAPKTDEYQLAKEIGEFLGEPHDFGTWPIAVAGVARARHGSRDGMRCADLAMNRAKRKYYQGGRTEVWVCHYDRCLDGTPDMPVRLAPAEYSAMRPRVRLRDQKWG